jgi:4-amino-4-deoxy-L-arabinose transferase-like glycosyltransferase
MSRGTTARRAAARPGGSRADRGARTGAASLASRLSWEAWTATGVTALFIALTCWWLSQDRSMPYSDAAVHLYTAFRFHDALAEGRWLAPLTFHFIYPPATPFVGSLGIFVGGRAVAAPIIAENLVYVPLLALACYRTGRLAYGRHAGMLAVVFALGSPLVIEQFHVFMLDAPLAALVAVATWLIIESDRFGRPGIALAAGLVTGVGLISKQSLPLYLAGLMLVVLARGGWRNWRGIVVFAGAAFAVAAPWYAYHASSIGQFLGAGEARSTVPPLAKPPLLSAANAEWYFWALANGLLFVPLLAFAIVGVGAAAVSTMRHPRQSEVIVDLLLGGLAAWLAITAMPHHDVRYSLPLTIFLAVLGTGWIVRLRSPGRWLAHAALVGAVVAATLGATFGIGSSTSAVLPGNRNAPHGEGVPRLNHLTVYSNHNFMVSGPRNGGDVLGLLKDLKREGIAGVVWFNEWAPAWFVDFNAQGLVAITKIAQLAVPYGTVDLGRLEAKQAVLIPERKLGSAPPCARLSGGIGLWIRRGNPWARGARDFCPRFDPPVYGP